MRIIYYSGKTRNTFRFVKKLELPEDSVLRLPQELDFNLSVDEPYILITPTYADGTGFGAVPLQVDRFLSLGNNASFLVGVIASGNRNFGATYAYAADVISRRFEVPILHRFELFGFPSDVETVKQRIAECR